MSHLTVVGDSAGRPLLSVAETRAGPLAVKKEAANTTNMLSHAREVSYPQQHHT